MEFRRYYASFVICDAAIERAAEGEHVPHFVLASRLGQRLGLEGQPREFVSGGVFITGKHAFAHVGPLRERQSRELARTLILDAFPSIPTLEIRFADATED